MNVAEVLADDVASQGDMIVGQGGFTTFGPNGWTGDLTYVTPGLGYLYYNASASKDLRLNTSTAFSPVSKSPSRSSDAPWRPDRYAYPSVMPVIAEVVRIDGGKADRSDVEVGAFCDTECRGAGVFVDGMLMMSVYGNPGDALTFRVLDKETGETMTLAQTAVFGNEPLGSLTAPYVFDMRRSGIDATGNGLSDSFRIDGGTLFAEGALSVTLFDADGLKTLSRRGEACHCIPLDGIQPGIYIVAVETPDGWSYTKLRL